MKASTKVLLIIALILIIVVPLMTLKGAEFGGADDQASDIIVEIDPEYSPWFDSIIEPASGEIESLLFAAQAAFGAGIIFYYLGYNRGKKRSSNERH